MQLSSLLDYTDSRRPSLRNELTLKFMYIELHGTMQDRKKLQEMVAKDAPLEWAKGYRSVARKCLTAFEFGKTYTENRETYDLETINKYSFDNLPDITLSIFYRDLVKAGK